MGHWHRVQPTNRILDVCYEDVVADLEAQARRVIGYCGLPWDDGCLSFHKTTVRSAPLVRRKYASRSTRTRSVAGVFTKSILARS